MRVIVYIRVSTDEQAASGAGLDAQRHACLAWAQREGCEAVGPFKDEISGAAPIDKRAGLLEAMAALQPGDVLTVAKRDRLGRDPILVAMIEATIARKKCRVVSAAGEGTDADDPSSILMRRLVDAFAEYERLIIKARTRSALAVKRRRGERTGAVPYGKRIDPSDPRRSKVKTGRDGNPSGGLPVAMVPDEAEMEALRLIESLRDRPLRQIALELDLRGIPTRSGKPWCHTTVAGILRRVS